MDLQRFEFYSHVITHIVRQNLPVVDSAVFEAAVEETVLIVLTTLDRNGEAAALQRLVALCELETTATDRPGDALRAALVVYVPPPDRSDGDTPARQLGAAVDRLYPRTQEPVPGEELPIPRSAREQQAELVRFLLDMEDTEPLIVAIAARLSRHPEYEADLLAAAIRPELLRQIKDYSTLLAGSGDKAAAEPPPPTDPARATGHAEPGDPSGYDAMMSYCSQDLDEVDSLRRALEQFDPVMNRALRVWIDHRDLLPGSPVLVTLCEVICLIRRYVFCCGRQLGRYQNDEMQRMVDRLVVGTGGERVMPVILSSVAVGHDPVPLLLRPYSYVDLRQLTQEAAVERLRRAICV